jgi:DNA-binding NarL/FixJ family response regulator
MTQVRVLLVDDSLEFLDSAAEFLTHDPRACVVGRAHDGREGLRLVEALSPDLVLMDLAMPVMSGLDAARAIKALTSPPLVVIVTLHDERGYRLDAHAAGAEGFICKADFASGVTAVIDSLFPRDPSRDPRSGSLT